MVKEQQIGLLGGTFDPIHYGHITLAIELMEAHSLDEVWLCPAHQNPHKKDAVITPADHRFKMVQLAVEPIPGFHAIDIEVRRKGPSYTIDTLEVLINEEKKLPSSPRRRFSLMLGDDAVVALPQWHRFQDIVALVPLLVGQRKGLCDTSFLRGYPEVYKAVLDGLTPTSFMEISATDLRERIRHGRYCGHLVPGKVLDYITEHRIYLS